VTRFNQLNYSHNNKRKLKWAILCKKLILCKSRRHQRTLMGSLLDCYPINGLADGSAVGRPLTNQLECFITFGALVALVD